MSLVLTPYDRSCNKFSQGLFAAASVAVGSTSKPSSPFLDSYKIRSE